MKGSKLTILIKGASNLNAIEANGLSNPYVSVEVEEQVQQTKVSHNTLNPIWNEKFCL